MTDLSWILPDGPAEETSVAIVRRKDCILAFYDWFCEPVGSSYRKWEFWDACDRGDKTELLSWLKTAWKLGYEQSTLGENNEPT